MKSEAQKLRNRVDVGSLVLRDVRDKGELDKERVVFDVSQNDDIGDYMVFESNSEDEESISTELKRTFWFPEKKIKAGDLVVLYTKAGTDKSKKNKNGSTSHFFYWSLDRPLWKRSNVVILITYLAEWQFVKPRSIAVDAVDSEP